MPSRYAPYTEEILGNMKPRLDLDETLNYVTRLEAGSHSAFAYRTPAEKRKVLFTFLQAGIEHGEGTIYVASQETANQVRRYMASFGINVRDLERDGVLSIYDCDGWYMVNGEVNIAHAMRMGYSAIEAATESGLKGVRFCGEAACFFDHQEEKALIEYERTIGRTLDFSATALCAYDASHVRSLEATRLFSLIKAHGPVITARFAQNEAFETVFPLIMEEALEEVFGELGKEMILLMLDKRHSLLSGERARRIADDPLSFLERLEDLVGSGAVVIQQSVAREMLAKLGLT